MCMCVWVHMCKCVFVCIHDVECAVETKTVQQQVGLGEVSRACMHSAYVCVCKCISRVVVAWLSECAHVSLVTERHVYSYRSTMSLKSEFTCPYTHKCPSIVVDTQSPPHKETQTPTYS